MITIATNVIKMIANAAAMRCAVSRLVSGSNGCSRSAIDILFPLHSGATRLFKVHKREAPQPRQSPALTVRTVVCRAHLESSDPRAPLSMSVLSPGAVTTPLAQPLKVPFRLILLKIGSKGGAIDLHLDHIQPESVAAHKFNMLAGHAESNARIRVPRPGIVLKHFQFHDIQVMPVKAVLNHQSCGFGAVPEPPNILFADDDPEIRGTRSMPFKVSQSRCAN